MKAVLGTALCTTSGMALAAASTALSAEAAVYIVATQGGIGPDTPISGVTVGAIVVGLVGASSLLAVGGRYLIRFGTELAKWQTALTAVSEDLPSAIAGIQRNVNENAAAIAENREAIEENRASAEELRSRIESLPD